MQDPLRDEQHLPESPASSSTPSDTPAVSKRKIPLYSIMAIGTTLALILGGIVLLVLHVQSKIPTSSWRERDTAASWESEAFDVTQAKTQWCDSKTNERMALRVACYPEISLELSEITKSGVLMISFLDVNKQRVGDIISLPFTTAGFRPTSDFNIKIEGNKVTCYPLGGMKTIEDYLTHQIAHHAPLWQAQLQYRLDGDARIHELNSFSIKPNNLHDKE